MNGEPQILARWVDPTIDDLKTALDEANKQITILSNMIDKAIEYIEENYPTSTINYQEDRYKLINILKGNDE